MTTKERVISILLNGKGQSFSGEELAKTCNVSRAAIWKAVNSLRAEGFSISGTTNGGYVLAQNQEIFSAEFFESIFSKRFPQFSENHTCECFSEIDSTNTYAKKLLSECGNLRNQNTELTEAGKKLHTATIIAESQTAGRGRLGRTFYSPCKTGLYLSIIFAPKGGIKNPASLTAYSAVAVCRAVSKLFAITPQIKWINDVFLNGKKIAGILTEGFTNFETGIIESAIIGIGVNIEENTSAFPKDVQNIAGSIVQNGDSCKINRMELAAEITGQVLTVLQEDPNSVISEYKSLNFLIGKELNISPIIDDEKSSYKAKAIDITEDASLVVELSDGTKKTLNSGEVTLKSKYHT